MYYQLAETNWEFICIIPIFWGHFWSNFGIWPQVCPQMRLQFRSFAIVFKEILPDFDANTYMRSLCIFNWP